MPPDPASGGESAPAIPLAHWADRTLAALARETGSPAIAALTGAQLLGERAALKGFAIPGRVSAGGGCRLMAARGGWIALNLARTDDRSLLPALFETDAIASDDDAAVAARVADCDAAQLLARGREMGLAIAATGEPAAAPVTSIAAGPQRAASPGAAPLVIDLSALWAGPLAGHLLWLAGATVVKVENPRRPDTMRTGDPALFRLLNQGKASVTLDPSAPGDRAALLALIARADIVIEAARPRALAQLGIDAGAIVAARAGLVWMTITGHGAVGEAAQWVGFGDDCGIAGGLGAALIAATGRAGFVGDAIADPLTGIAAARAGWEAWRKGRSCRIGLAMSGIVASALAEERARDPAGLSALLRAWGDAKGNPFPQPPPRRASAPLPSRGADNARWTGTIAPC